MSNRIQYTGKNTHGQARTHEHTSFSIIGISLNARGRQKTTYRPFHGGNTGSSPVGRATYARARYGNFRAPFVRHAPALRSVKIPPCAVLEWSNILKNVAELGVNSMKGAHREGKCHTGHAPGDREEALDAGDDCWRAR
jgi:hypothetical protein